MIWIAGFVVMVASLVGVVFTHSFAARFLETKLAYLVSFSAGVFLVTAGALALEVFELADTVWLAVGMIALGYVGAWSLEYLLPESHQHHDPECDHHHHHGAKKSARKLIVGDAVHNVADGIMLVPAFLVSPVLGVAVTVSILIHEVLQEISEFFVLRQAGYSTKQALGINFLVSSTIFVGIVLSYVAVANHDLEVFLLALSAGFFLHVVLHDLIPKPHHHTDSHGFAKHILVLLVGLAVMAVVAFVIKGEHVHGEGDHHEYEEGHHEVMHHDEVLDGTLEHGTTTDHHEAEVVHDHHE